MQHEEQDPRHPHHRDHHPPRPRRPEHFHDFRSRWGEPVPAIYPGHPEWQPEEERMRPDRRFHREEWLPEQQRHHQPHPEHFHRMEEQYPLRPIWHQRDVYFDPSNQRVEDRWFEDPLMPHPNRRQTRHYDGFWQDYED